MSVRIFKQNNLLHILKFSSVGVVNTIFGYSIYAGFVAIGISPQLSQLIAFIIGTSFNYLSYSRLVFSQRSRNKVGFIINYLFMYIYSAILLYLLNLYINPYYSGLIVLVISTVINFTLLNFTVFKKK